MVQTHIHLEHAGYILNICPYFQLQIARCEEWAAVRFHVFRTTLSPKQVPALDRSV
jgi:hypothetical protein